MRGTLLYLIITSLIWALSFGLIKRYLVGYDPLAVATVRLALSLLVFAPFLRPLAVGGRRVALSLALGAVQFGAMYWLYITAYGFLPAYGVALLTIFTPLYVVLLENLLARRWAWRHVAAGVLAIVGAATIVVDTFEGTGAVLGILLVQGSNLCFAAGQIGFRFLVREGRGAKDDRSDSSANLSRVPEVSLLAWMYVGAFGLTAAASILFVDFDRVSFDSTAILTLLYLGILPTGVGFYLWNKGAARAGPGVLAAANNLKVPLAVLAAWFVFGEAIQSTADATGLWDMVMPYVRVLGGLAVILAGLALANEPKTSRS
ncbi:EamA family transporter [Myxococcota bacterium]